MALSLTLCGRVSVAGEDVTPAAAALSAKSLALLAYVSLEPGPHSRDELAAFLWGDYPDAKAKASLRQALVHLREALPKSIRVDRTSVELVGPVDSDVGRFLRLSKASTRGAAECAVSGFLETLHLRRCPAFDEWADRMRGTLARRSSEVLATATREALVTRQLGDAVRFGHRWVSLAPGSETAVTALMEAHFVTGDHAAALDVFARYLAHLAESGETPAAAVEERAARIEESAASTRGRRQATEEWYAAAPTFDGPLVGRSAEWDALTHAWSKATQGRSRVALIEGDAGVGKSRLASDFLRWVTAEGGTVLRGRAYDVRGGVPFGAVIEALRSAVDAPGLAGTDPQWLAEVARVVPELRTRFRALGDGGAPAADRWRLFEGVAQMLAALGEEAPVAILIDDLHWCDADSCTLLHSLIRTLENTPILWCLTLSPGSVERDAPAARLIRALRAFPQTVSVTLRALSEDEVWQLVHGIGRVSSPHGARRLASRIHEVTSGYPFYIIELLKTLFAQGWLTVDPDTGEWIVSAQTGGEVLALDTAPSVHEAIAERIQCLPDEVNAVLISLAVSARGCRAHVLSYVHGISRLHAAMLGDALVERHLAVEEEGVYRCAHPVIARVVSDGLGTSRRREVNRGLALALENAAREGAIVDPGEIARHAELGGERAMAFRYAVTAAAASESRAAYEEALTWLDFASGVATTAADADDVNRTTARLLQSAGWHEAPRVDRSGISPGRLAVADVDLPARV